MILNIYCFGILDTDMYIKFITEQNSVFSVRFFVHRTFISLQKEEKIRILQFIQSRKKFNMIRLQRSIL